MKSLLFIALALVATSAFALQLRTSASPVTTVETVPDSHWALSMKGGVAKSFTDTWTTEIKDPAKVFVTAERNCNNEIKSNPQFYGLYRFEKIVLVKIENETASYICFAAAPDA